MTGHLRQQIIIINNVKNLGDLSIDKLQGTLDKFNRYTERGGSMTDTTKRERRMGNEPIGWTSIDRSTEALIRQEWTDERMRMERKERVFPIGARKVVDVNNKGRPIMRKGRRILMTFEYRQLKGTHNPRWVTKTWKFVE